MISRKEELTKYIELLAHLKMTGIECDKKIEEALDELHGFMVYREHDLCVEAVDEGIKVSDSDIVVKNPFDITFG